MGAILVLIYILLTLCGIIVLLFELQKIQAEPVIQDILTKLFDLLNLPLAAFVAILSTAGMFINGEGISKLVIASIFILISFFIERVREHLHLNKSAVSDKENISEHKPLFAYIDTYYELIKINKNILKDIYDAQSTFSRQAEQTMIELHLANSRISDYIDFQKAQCLTLLENRNSCESIFKTLEENAERYNHAFSVFEQKLSAANTAIEYTLNSEKLLNDIFNSFQKEYNQNSEDIMIQSDRILSVLNSLVYKCSQFQHFLKPYENVIDIYSIKIDSTLMNLEKKYNANQTEVLKASESIHDNILNFEKEFKKIFGISELYLQKNLFVLSKILETCNNGTLSRQELKKT
jgi:hypothetical protein